MMRSSIQPLLASEDLSYGQMVMIAARWIFVVTGLLLALLAPGGLLALRFQILVLLMLAVANFYLYTQAVMRRPALQVVIYATSLADLMIVTFLILLAPQDGGVYSPLFVFYFPALLVISVTFPGRMLSLFAGSTITLYGLVALAGGGGIAFDDIPIVVIRLMMLAAIVVCGGTYGDIERRRRAAPQPAAPQPAAPQSAAARESVAEAEAPVSLDPVPGAAAN